MWSQLFSATSLVDLGINRRGIFRRRTCGLPWHISAYFDGLEWSTADMPITTLELLLDFYAFTGSDLVNQKSRGAGSHGGRVVSAARDYVSLFGALVRALPKQLQNGRVVHPGRPCDSSGLTPFGLPKQAVSLTRRPRLRCSEKVFTVLTWARLQSHALVRWDWEIPWHLLVGARS